MEIDVKNDFGFSTVDRAASISRDDAEDRLQQVRAMILPLLDNLAKDPKKDIHWPDRDKTISEFKRKLLRIIDVQRDTFVVGIPD